MNINEQAPVKSTKELKIEATPEVVWALIARVGSWPDWNPAVSKAKLEGDFAPGSVFRWKSGGSGIVSTIHDVDRPRRACWTGQAFGTKAVHVWTIEAVGAGSLVKTSESFDGWLVAIMRAWFQRFLDKALEDVLRSLKIAAEKASPNR
jgi:hypothetical protein